jgi:beta-glucosidase
MNPTLVPTWKERTHSTHQTHLTQYDGKQVDYAFIGDSMIERWLSTGKSFWANLNNKSICANLGVGGDKLQHLLYRIDGTKVKSILDTIHVTKGVILMIGSNNLEQTSTAHLVAGIINVVNMIARFCPTIKICVYGLTDRTDVATRKISDVNDAIRSAILMAKNDQIKFRFFGNLVNQDDTYFDDFVHLSDLGYNVWYDNLLDIVN